MSEAVKTEYELRQAQIDNAFSYKDRVEVVKHLLGFPMGRKFIWWLLSKSKIFSSTLEEHHVMSFNEGRRWLGLQIFELTQSNEETRQLFVEMQKEQINRTERG